MSTTKHTAEPWYVLSPCDRRSGTTIHGGKKYDEQCTESPTLAKVTSCLGRERQEANATRIVACVNACAGINDPVKALELVRVALRASLTNFSGADDSEIRAALRALGG